MSNNLCRLIGVCVALAIAIAPVQAQENKELAALEKAVAAATTVQKKVMVPMRDGIRLATDVYLPVDAKGPLPTIFWRTPYNFNKLGKRRLELLLSAAKQGYAFIIQNERGKFFSEGEWEILGRPRTDGYDALTWIADQSWSNDNVGTIGCSSSAEWQLALAAMNHPAHAAMVPMAAGAGIGRVAPFNEQGNWYRGGAFQMLFATWLYSVQNTERPRLPEGLVREDVVRLSRYFDLAPDMPDVDWDAGLSHLPLVDIMTNVDGPSGIFAEFIQRAPDDPAWFEGGLYQDDEPFEVPSLWMNSWYDVSIGPNLALFNHVTHNAKDPEVAANQFVVIAPTPHCQFAAAEEETIVGERNVGDARLDYDTLIFDWFDRWLKEEKNGFADKNPKVRYYTMGKNEWQTAAAWPPEDITETTYYLASDGKANSRFGDGVLSRRRKTGGAGADTFPYDPQTPVPSLGGGVCCSGGTVRPGAFDQKHLEARHDVLVYTSEPLEEGIEVSGFVEVTLYVSSDVRDTDFSLKLIDVSPDGTAYNLDDTIQRARYRDGYDKPVFMDDGKVYKLVLGPLSTSNFFAAGHSIRIEVSSSNFPRYARNLNTGGHNHDETEGVVAHNSVHHSRNHPSRITLPVVRR